MRRDYIQTYEIIYNFRRLKYIVMSKMNGRLIALKCMNLPSRVRYESNLHVQLQFKRKSK